MNPKTNRNLPPILWVMLLSLLPFIGWAQDPDPDAPPLEEFECPHNAETRSTPEYSADCSRSSTNWAYYGDHDSWRPHFGTPIQTTPTKVIRVRFIVVQDANGGNNWDENNATHTLMMNTIVNRCNNTLANVLQPPTNCGVGNPLYPDLFIQIRLVGIDYVQDDFGNDQCDYYNSNRHYNLYNNAISGDVDMNIFFQQPPSSGSPAGYASAWNVNYTDPSSNAGLFLNRHWSKYTDIVDIGGNHPSWYWIWGGDNLAHEVLHNLGLSHTTFCDNQMNNNNYGHALTEAQMGTTHYSLAFRNIRKYVDDVYDETPLVITDREVWDFDMKLYRDVIIAPGASLTVKCMVTMPELGKFVVKPGGELILDNGKLTCEEANKGSMWEGVYVEGNSTAPQTTANQGYLKLMNGAVIEHARDAAVAFGLHDYVGIGGNVDWSTTGGIIESYDSYFLNNWRAISFLTYQQEDAISRFEGTTFEVNQQLRDYSNYPQNVGIDGYVTIYRTDGIVFEDCLFQNTDNDAIAGEACGKGIVAQECTFSAIKGTDPTSLGCYFINLTRGIEVSRSALVSSGTLDVTGGIFQNCKIGMYIDGDAQGYDISNNSFDKTDLPPYTLSDPEFGIYANDARGLNIVGNFFGRFTYGVLLKNTSTIDDPQSNVYDNYFTDNMRHLQTQSSNLQLYVKCNNFNDPEDVSQMYWMNWSGAIVDQGSCNSVNAPAGNLFNELPDLKDIYSNTAFNYAYHYMFVPVSILPEVWTAGNPSLTACNSLSFDEPYACDGDLGPFRLAPARAYLDEALDAGNFASARKVVEEAVLSPEGKWYFDLQIDLAENERDPWELNGKELAKMTSLANSDDRSASAAQGFLAFFYGQQFETEKIPAGNELSAAAAAAERAPFMEAGVPNPSSESSRVDYYLPDGMQANIVLRDALGRTIARKPLQSGTGQVELETSSLENGIYLYSFEVEGHGVQTRKLVVQH